MKRVTLTQFLIEQQRKEQVLPAQLRLLLEIVARACKAISFTIGKGELGDVLGSHGSENIQGEVQKKLDVIANDLLVEANEWGGHLAALASEEMDTIHVIPNRYPKGEYLLLYDPIDGSSNIDVNLTVGTIFSVLVAPEDAAGRPISEADFLQSGSRQVAAGYAVYGPQTMLVLTVAGRLPLPGERPRQAAFPIRFRHHQCPAARNHGAPGRVILVINTCGDSFIAEGARITPNTAFEGPARCVGQ